MTPSGTRKSAGDTWAGGRVLSDRYRVIKMQRCSSSTCIYEALDVFRETRHLLVRPSDRVVQGEGGLDWFLQFCRGAMDVPEHPNLLASRRLDNDGAVPYLVMDHLEGSYWDTAVRNGELTDLTDMLDVAIQTARGLEWLHENGHIHGNMKPANVLIEDETGLVQLVKYGETHAHTRAYAAPEQLRDKAPSTASTDLWCWGTSVLHMFSGIVNWASGARASRALDRYVDNGPAVPGLALMPVGVVVLLQQCFREDPAQRPASTGEVVGQLEELYRDVTNAEYAAPGMDSASESDHLVTGPPAPRSRRGRRPGETAPPRRRFSARRRNERKPHPRRKPDRNS